MKLKQNKEEPMINSSDLSEGEKKETLLRALPSVDSLLQSEVISHYTTTLSRKIVVAAIQNILDDYRQSILQDKMQVSIIKENDITGKIVEALEKRQQGYLKKVINATGIIVHTNLGRSVFSKEIAQNVIDLITHYNNLEYDLIEGKRSSRYDHLTPLLKQLTGYDDSLIVNNNAAALLLILDTFAKGKDVIISRGELVEIGGGFRIPEVMKKADARLVEVGCTNKTYIDDYANAISENTGLVIKVHRSNFALTGFVSEPTLAEMSLFCKTCHVPFLYDLGSGNLLPRDSFHWLKEPHLQECMHANVPLVCFSGDKILGGPQAGIILGDHETISTLKKNQLLRALRVDKMCIAALEATLNQYMKGINALEASIPTIRMLRMPLEEIEVRSKNFMEFLLNKLDNNVSISMRKDHSQLGGGSLPLQQLETFVIELETTLMSTAQLDSSLRALTIPVITRIANNKLIIDLRTVLKEEEQILQHSLLNILSTATS